MQHTNRLERACGGKCIYYTRKAAMYARAEERRLYGKRQPAVPLAFNKGQQPHPSQAEVAGCGTTP